MTLKLRKHAKGKTFKTSRGVLKSLLEKRTLLRLKKLTKGKKTDVTYETHVLPYTLRKNYIPDFVVHFSGGKVLYIEAKGWFRPEDRTKMAAVKRDNPHLDIRFVFPCDNKLNKNTTTRYSDWCVKHNFTYCIGDVPKEWLNE